MNREMNKYISLTSDVYQQKIIECFEVVQNEIETSFNKIDSYLDSILNISCDSLNSKTLKNEACVPIFDQPQNKFEKSNFSQQLYQDIQPLIIYTFNNQIKLKDQLLNQTQTNQEIQSLTNQSNIKPFNYQLISQYSISQNECCFAIAINKDCSTLLAGCDKQIKVFEFKQGMTKQTQILSEHQNRVFTLNIMKKSNQFISGSCDNSMIIWQQNQNNQWTSQYILNGHDDWVYCLILNNNEDLIVSGSKDNTIRFWMKKNEWSCQQTIQDHSHHVYGLSFNQQQNRVVSCGQDKLVLIMEQQGQNKEWIVIQKITVEQIAWRVCFIDNNMFTLSQRNYELISIFEMNKINQQFTKTTDINVKCGSDSNCLFPQQYIHSKCILVSKNGQYVNLIRKTLNGQFVTQQSIHFNTNSLFGGMSDDGEYLITWDNNSMQIQIRRYQEQ
ncbi:unnamed protein product [Paramecium octaurelia]|uniref:WD domain, G-beta repeat protein n=1 Tax=Paramecium octaurelia TaxID=43137 RepID=A0A8S1YKE6_PAROT|nr:unnamed protein product [Paramecium octaurelia]